MAAAWQPVPRSRHDEAVSEATPEPQPREPSEPSEAFIQLQAYLQDPHRSEVAAQWEAVVQSKLGREDRAKAEMMAPVVKAYLSREIEREEYEQRLAATNVPTP